MQKLGQQVVHKFHEWRQIRGHLVMFSLALCIALAITFADISTSFAGNASWSSLLRKVSRDQSYQNEFIRTFKESIEKDPIDIKGQFTPLIITEDGRRLLCKPSFKDIALYRRVGHFARMIRSGMKPHLLKGLLSKYNYGMNGSLPILLMVSDAIGCEITRHADNYIFPRLTWSFPSHSNQDNEWCNDVAIPSYEIWKEFGSKSKTSWEKTYATNNVLYPWSKKIHKAVWRGSTTFDASQYGNSSFHDIPRAKLVQASMDHPSVLDAAFTKIHQRFEEKKEELALETRVTDRIPFEDQMKYRGETYSGILCFACITFHLVLVNHYQPLLILTETIGVLDSVSYFVQIQSSSR
jgi:hypothetical protein